jgi:hypothetical protein
LKWVGEMAVRLHKVGGNRETDLKNGPGQGNVRIPELDPWEMNIETNGPGG